MTAGREAIAVRGSLRNTMLIEINHRIHELRGKTVILGSGRKKFNPGMVRILLKLYPPSYVESNYIKIN